jgi:hypothetical protein
LDFVQCLEFFSDYDVSEAGAAQYIIQDRCARAGLDLPLMHSFIRQLVLFLSCARGETNLYSIGPLRDSLNLSLNTEINSEQRVYCVDIKIQQLEVR